MTAQVGMFICVPIYTIHYTYSTGNIYCKLAYMTLTLQRITYAKGCDFPKHAKFVWKHKFGNIGLET